MFRSLLFGEKWDRKVSVDSNRSAAVGLGSDREIDQRTGSGIGGWGLRID